MDRPEAEVPAVEVVECSDLDPAVRQTYRGRPSLQPPAGIVGPCIVVDRHALTWGDGYYLYDMSTSTHIRGYDSEGALVTRRSFTDDRTTAVGKKWQTAMEKWKMARVRRAVARTIGSVSLGNELEEDTVDTA